MAYPASLLDALAQALLGEERARAEVRAALARQADLLRQLRGLGLPATRVAHRVAASWGVSLSVSDRLRLARRLRKRAERETSRRADLAGAHGLAPSPTSSWSWAITPSQEEVMAKLVKRTITEEYVEEKVQDLDEVEEDDGDEGDEESHVEEKPAKARRR